MDKDIDTLKDEWRHAVALADVTAAKIKVFTGAGLAPPPKLVMDMAMREDAVFAAADAIRKAEPPKSSI